jgi:hypothetical protein
VVQAGIQPVNQAADAEAQSILRNAMTGAKVFFTNGTTYTGFNAAAARLIEPALAWSDAGAAVDAKVVHIHVANGADLILDTLSESGAVFCIEDDPTVGTTYGTVDASTPHGCNGTW